MKNLVLLLAILDLAIALAVPGVAWIVDSQMGTEVQMIAPHAKEVAAMERLLADENTPVVSLYGEPLGEPVRLVLFDDSKLVVPEENPKLRLLPVDKQSGENPLQAKTVWFAAKWASIISAIFGLAGIGLWLFLRSRRNNAA